MLSWVSFLICHGYCSGTWASHLRSLWKWEQWGEHCFICYLLLWLSVWIVHFFRARAKSSISLQLFFANCSGVTNKALGKCEAEKEEEEEHNYDYVDENIIENIRKVFQDTTIRNKHALSEGRRWVWPMITYECKQVWAEWFFRLAGNLDSPKQERVSPGSCPKYPVNNAGRAPLSCHLWPPVTLSDATFVKAVPIIVLVIEVHRQDQVYR